LAKKTTVRSLLKKAGLRTNNKLHIYAMSAPPFEEIKAAYPPASDIEDKDNGYNRTLEYKHGNVKISYSIPSRKDEWRRDERDSCSLGGWKRRVGKCEGKYYYQWRGETLLESDELISLDVLDEINKAKDEELSRNKKKRRQTIKTPIDAVRVTLMDHGYKPSMQNGALRVYVLRSCHLSFKVEEPYDVIVSFGYYSGGRSGGASYEEIDKLNLADPKFSETVARMLTNASNILDFIAGRTP
jgi:hypothetical protein